MKKATITKTVDLLDGGCNVCGIIENENYTLIIDEKSILLDELTVNSLVTAIALNNGYKREYEIDVLDDYTLYKKEDYQVRMKEEYDFLTYANETIKIETKDQILDKKELITKVNEITIRLFGIEELMLCF
ncbi:DUF4809 domain-containing protein [Enterococcus ureilyticus]|uniref:DUF4809 domain-containing protein n=1 Tax=Enterococcus ureilyticus TaxID=1131292 RepID=A0A1E5H955_9ENTE|nr:DUF4809 family protein [Enterococcus ureilyticus]MBM7688382.1 hypothetical protein [Enterococcus ureilyticus]OEG21487.1 DUF4809 domain-containing protein [Enterococcus ureilyticus]